MLQKMRKAANAHPFWCPLLSVKNIGILLLIYGGGVAFAIVTMSGDEANKHVLSIVGLLLPPIAISVVCGQMVYRDYRQLQQARKAKNSSTITAQIAKCKTALCLFLSFHGMSDLAQKIIEDADLNDHEQLLVVFYLLRLIKAEETK